MVHQVLPSWYAEPTFSDGTRDASEVVSIPSRAFLRYCRRMSAPAIDRTRVLHIAKLSALSLHENEVDQLASDLNAIVKYVDELAEVDMSDVPPTTQVQFEASLWREDEVVVGLTRDQALSSAPQVEHEGFAVPVFVEGAS